MVEMIIHPAVESAWEHVSLVFGGAAALGVVAHAVNTFPTPKSAMGKWLLGTIQYVVGQRMQALQKFPGDPAQAQNAMAQQDTKSIAATGGR